MPSYGLATFCVVYFAAVATPGPGVAAVPSDVRKWRQVREGIQASMHFVMCFAPKE